MASIPVARLDSVQNSTLNHRRQTVSLDRGVPVISSNPFAGRIGGNQQFLVSQNDPDYDKVLAKAPDAATNAPWRDILELRSFSDRSLWNQAVIEGVGTCLQVFLSGLLGLGLAPLAKATSLGALLPVSLGALGNLLLVPLFVFAGGPVSGGHFNPLISMATFATRLSSLPRTVLYVVFQCLGAITAGFLVRAGLGLQPEQLRIVPGCFIDTSLVAPGQVYVLETTTALTLLFLSFGVGLDPRQQGVFGPALSPILVGFVSVLCTLCTGFVLPGYLGTSLNPARCLGMMSASESFGYHYVHWTGDITAAIINGILYHLFPPYKS